MTWNCIDDYDGDRYQKFGDKIFDMAQLKIDEHFFTVSTDNSEVNLSKIYLYSLNEDCVLCPYSFVDKSVVNISSTNNRFRLATDFRQYYPEDDAASVICDLNHQYGQFGVYNFHVNNLSSCEVEVLKDPVNIYSPMLTVLLIHFLIFGGLCLALAMWKKWQENRASVDGSKESSAKKERILSLDTFRGISIVIMIFANFGNGGYDVIQHATWNGLHVADLVFPWFMWIMGACIPISLASSFKKGVPNKDIMWNVSKRSIKLFLLGIFLNSGCNLYYIRIFGVLQRFGLCYFIVTTICVFTMHRDLSSRSQHYIMKHFDDILKVWKAWIISSAILVVHTILIFVVAAPGCPRVFPKKSLKSKKREEAQTAQTTPPNWSLFQSYMGPGGLHKNQQFYNCVGGATGYIDRLILGNHVYQNPTIYSVYEAKPFDPEGIVGCLTTIFHVMLGVQAGVTLLVFKEHYQRVSRWLVWSLILGILGGALCGFSSEDGLIPVNKNLWSLSFVFVTSCFAFVLLSVCYFLIDVKKWWSGKPLLFAGMNAIILYIGHEMTDGHFPVRWYFAADADGSWRNTHFISLLSDAWGADFWVLVSYYLHKINYYFTI
uniref:Heparan-alpha-glucosaminide N-acetyltransferase catalytic domain-containing protein n=1 Tax=Dendroctonus ponderosae TaxID=77166 RepID=A0AAR5PNL4_DENPD